MYPNQALAAGPQEVDHNEYEHLDTSFDASPHDACTAMRQGLLCMVFLMGLMIRFVTACSFCSRRYMADWWAASFTRTAIASIQRMPCVLG